MLKPGGDCFSEELRDIETWGGGYWYSHGGGQMPFQVRSRLISFMGDPQNYPCTFGYKIGDEIVYDGERFHGRICPGLLREMMPVIYAINKVGKKFGENIISKYYPPRQNLSEGEKKFLRDSCHPTEIVTEKQDGYTFVCSDTRTSALFLAEPFDLVKRGITYRRQMSMVEKVEAEPGIDVKKVLERFNKEERDEYPAMHPLLVELMLDELEQVNYIEIRGGKAYPKSS